MKYFNTAGPVNQENHYKLDPLHRWDLDEMLMLIEQSKYFIVHAPRQSGKTSSLLALQKYINDIGKYQAIYVNFECGQSARHNVNNGIIAIINSMKSRLKQILKKEKEIDDIAQDVLQNGYHGSSLSEFLERITLLADKPLILMIDEIDSLIGDTLVSVLRQLRSHYDLRPERFPKSIILCGVADVKDYKIHRSDGEIITGGSCFNIKSNSLKMNYFTQAEIKKLYEEHTQETGQVFEENVYDLIWELTQGQPWLVNALAYEACFEMKENRDRSVIIDAEIIRIAKDRLILSRATHLDQLADKLKENRVRRVIEPMLNGEISQASHDDRDYCIDLGLVRASTEGLVISNRIYQEVLPRELASLVQQDLLSLYKPKWVNLDGTINSEKLIELFVQFWRENSEIWSEKISGYKEAAPHLVFQGFLQRVSNGKGIIEREYGFGMKRADLYLRWKSPQKEQRIVFELKMRTQRESSEKAFAQLKETGIRQSMEYADKCGADEVYLMIFDRRENMKWEEKIYRENRNCDSYSVQIVGL